jgi:hypothetical protein
MWSTVRHLTGTALLLAVLAPAPALAAPATAGAVPAPLTGAWVKTMSLATWHRHSVYVELPGRWSIVITSRGVTSIIEPPAAPGDAPLTTMQVRGTSGSVVFGPTADDYCSTNATYTWKATGATVVFKAVNDPCIPRRVLLTVGAWARR